MAQKVMSRPGTWLKRLKRLTTQVIHDLFISCSQVVGQKFVWNGTEGSLGRMTPPVTRRRGLKIKL